MNTKPKCDYSLGKFRKWVENEKKKSGSSDITWVYDERKIFPFSKWAAFCWAVCMKQYQPHEFNKNLSNKQPRIKYYDLNCMINCEKILWLNKDLHIVFSVVNHIHSSCSEYVTCIDTTRNGIICGLPVAVALKSIVVSIEYENRLISHTKISDSPNQCQCTLKLDWEQCVLRWMVSFLLLVSNQCGELSKTTVFSSECTILTQFYRHRLRIYCTILQTIPSYLEIFSSMCWVFFLYSRFKKCLHIISFRHYYF